MHFFFKSQKNFFFSAFITIQYLKRLSLLLNSRGLNPFYACDLASTLLLINVLCLFTVTAKIMKKRGKNSLTQFIHKRIQNE